MTHTITACPRNVEHRLSACGEPRCYYCYACAVHYHESQLTTIPYVPEDE